MSEEMPLTWDTHDEGTGKKPCHSRAYRAMLHGTHWNGTGRTGVARDAREWHGTHGNGTGRTVVARSYLRRHFGLQFEDWEDLKYFCVIGLVEHVWARVKSRAMPCHVARHLHGSSTDLAAITI
jgi:hypothetical protein